jgi:Protein of unknown function (DUF3501)
MLTRADILSLHEFEQIRDSKKQEILLLKQVRRLHVGPDITFYFENIQTIWWQIHEMLRIEKGGEAQIADELCAYNPMIPLKITQGYQISATMMVEIDDPLRRQVVLKQLFGIDQQINFSWNTITVPAFNIDPSEERNRESDGKTSAVHFLKWLLPSGRVSEFLEKDVILAITNPYYNFKSTMPLSLKDSLKTDFEMMN